MLNLSACILTKDNQQYIEKCLESLARLDCEIIVLDTGSMDNTVEICKKYTSHVYQTIFENDFSKARNECISYASKDWILVVDSDEYIPPESILKIREAINGGGRVQGYALSIVNIVKNKKNNNTIYTRLFRNHPEVRFEGRLHEQIMPSLFKVYGNECVVLIDIEIFHDGYDFDEQEDHRKFERNIRILESYDEAEKDGYYYFNLGNEYLRRGEVEVAKKYYNKSYQKVETWDLGYAVALGLNLVVCLFKLEEYSEVINKCNELLSYYNEFHCIYLLRGVTYVKYGQYSQALQDIYGYLRYKSYIGYPFIDMEVDFKLNNLIQALINTTAQNV